MGLFLWRKRVGVRSHVRVGSVSLANDGFSLTSTVTFAEETSTETCANGAGTVITGAVTGHKYCMSNNTMNWWNSVSWCDGVGARLFSVNDCAFSSTSDTSVCPELKGVGSGWIWAATPKGTSDAYGLNVSLGSFGSIYFAGSRASNHYTLCY